MFLVFNSDTWRNNNVNPKTLQNLKELVVTIPGIKRKALFSSPITCVDIQDRPFLQYLHFERPANVPLELIARSVRANTTHRVVRSEIGPQLIAEWDEGAGIPTDDEPVPTTTVRGMAKVVKRVGRVLTLRRPKQSQTAPRVNKYFFNDQTWAYKKGKIPTHHYRTVLKMGKSLNFKGHTRGYVYKLVNLGTRAKEQYHQKSKTLNQPNKYRRWRRRYTTYIKAKKSLLTQLSRLRLPPIKLRRKKARRLKEILRVKKQEILKPWRPLLPTYRRLGYSESGAIFAKEGTDFSIQFENFVVVTQPTLAFYPIKRRSYKKKKKIYILKHALKIAKPKNRLGKLFSIIKHLYFRWKRRHNRIDVQKGLLEFTFKELVYFPNNQTRLAKVDTHERIGRDAVNDIIFRRRLETAQSK